MRQPPMAMFLRVCCVGIGAGIESSIHGRMSASHQKIGEEEIIEYYLFTFTFLMQGEDESLLHNQ